MGRGYTGDSKSDKAYNRMERAMERSDRANRNRERKPLGNPILAQLQELYPDTWTEELAKMRKEHNNQNDTNGK